MSFVVVKGCAFADALQRIGGGHLAGSTVAAEEVFTSKPPAGAALGLAETDGWCVLMDPLGLLVTGGGCGDLLPLLSEGTVALGFFLAGSTGTCAFRLCSDGVERRWVIHEAGATLEERSVPLAEEAAIAKPAWGYDEAWVFTLLERLTGLTWARLVAQSFALASAPDLYRPRSDGAG